MAQYNDPTVCHPGECSNCGMHVEDRDEDLDEAGECDDCSYDSMIAAYGEDEEDEDA